MQTITTIQPSTACHISILVAEDIIKNNIDSNINAAETHLQQALVTLGHTVTAVTDGHLQLSEQCALYKPNLLILNTDSLNSAQLKEIIFIDQLSPIPILILVKETVSAAIRQSIASKSCAYVADATQANNLSACISIAYEQFNTHQTRRATLEETKKQLKDRKVITQALDYLMMQKRVNEEDALKLLKQMAMKNGQSLTITANNVVSVCTLLKQYRA